MKNIDTFNLSSHPAITCAESIKSICSPLQGLNIHYFSHVHIDEQHNMSLIINDPNFMQYYLSKQYYNSDIHMADAMSLGPYVIWDLIQRRGRSKLMHDEASAFGINNTFTIIKQHAGTKDYYHFACRQYQQSINQEYLQHLDQLELFILYFRDKVFSSKSLRQAYDISINLDKQAGKYDTIEENEAGSMPLTSLDIPECRKYVCRTDAALSPREMQVLLWLDNGKTLDEIALILGISLSTINKHIDSAKHKLGCYTLFQLGKRTSELFKNTLPHLKRSLIK